MHAIVSAFKKITNLMGEDGDNSNTVNAVLLTFSGNQKRNCYLVAL